MNSTSRVSAIILAGGGSTRMGQDKALLEIDGVPLLRRTYEVAQQSCDRVSVVTPWIERYQSVLPTKHDWIRETPLPNESFPHGPLIGFAQGLVHLQAKAALTDWILLLACDLPNLNSAVVQQGLAQLAEVQQAIALLPKHPKGWEPLCGFYHHRCLPLALEFIAAGGRSFQDWLQGIQVAELSIAHPEVLFNCNTPNDLEIARSQRQRTV
jgi:molybdopterin-guanine dinucleotide biosynthesis protein A